MEAADQEHLNSFEDLEIAPSAEVKDKDAEEAPADEAISALRDNIKNKGKNSYYYAHENTSNAPAWDGQPQPRLLGKETSENASCILKPITNYAWGDEAKKIKIYIPLDGIGDHPDGKINLTWAEKSFSLLIESFDGKDHGLNISELQNSITKAAVRKKADKLVLTLTKEDEVTWHHLKKND
uniref:CS domain-containing protein n=1 Tax=Heterosigma akashiwo TaxID=2829 RepID=A0A7S3Y1R8_HETAK